MVSNGVHHPSSRGERGAVSVKAVLILTFVLISAVVLIKMVPVYIEQQQIEHDTDELARKASLGITAYSKDRIEKEIQSLTQSYQLPEGSIQLASMDNNQAEISLKYTRNVDLFITSYAWSVDYKTVHRGI
jgi:hypothetical protein